MSNVHLDENIYHAFGDASTGQAGTFYGFILIPENNVVKALEHINSVKILYGGKEDFRLHCRELFNDHTRQKSVWRHLANNQAISLCSDILNGLAPLDIRYCAGIMPVEHYPRSFRLRGKNGHPDLTHPIDDKWRELWTYHRAALMLDPTEIKTPPDPKAKPNPLNHPWWQMHGRLVAPAFKVSRVYLDRETTDIQWFSKRFRWDTLAKDFAIYGTQGLSYLPIQETTPQKHYLLDIADLFVWNMARSFTMNPVIFVKEITDVHTVICAPAGEEIVFGEPVN